MNPYLRLGLVGNPFSYDIEDRTEPIDRNLGFQPEPSSRALVELVGVRGCGKSTQLGVWRGEVPGPYLHVEPAERPDLPIASIAYWDEADRIPVVRLLMALARIRDQRGTVVIGTHKSLATTARLMGLRVHTFLLDGPSVGQIQGWAHRAIDSASLGRPSLAAVPALEIVDRCGGSWRRAGHLLHAWAAGEAGVSVRNPIRSDLDHPPFVEQRVAAMGPVTPLGA